MFHPLWVSEWFTDKRGAKQGGTIKIPDRKVFVAQCRNTLSGTVSVSIISAIEKK